MFGESHGELASQGNAEPAEKDDSKEDSKEAPNGTSEKKKRERGGIEEAP